LPTLLRRWQPADETPLVRLANRDEFYARPTQGLTQWPASPVIAGRDLEGGGTWLGVTADGRVAALTNYRNPAMTEDGRPSRGALVQGFLESHLDSTAYLAELACYAHQYNPFNLIVYDGQTLAGCESRGSDYRVIRPEPGVGCLSNADFDSAWPKVTRLRDALADIRCEDETTDQQLLALLENSEVASESMLPETGIPLDLERALSAAFIALPAYGTRASTVVRVHQDSVYMLERSFNAEGRLSDVAISRARSVSGKNGGAI
jgi:uncharacterized protein with NRDE domain